MRWVVQENLGDSEDMPRLFKAIEDAGHELVKVTVVPFSQEAVVWNGVKNMPLEPEDTMLTVFYGSTKFIERICGRFPYIHKRQWYPGVWFNPKANMLYQIDNWQSKMLNYGSCYAGSLRDLKNSSYDLDKLLFVRPVEDDKSFAGNILSFKEIKELEKIVMFSGNDYIQVLWAEPYSLSVEYRLFIINKKVVAGSRYRTYGRLNPHPDVPMWAIDFAEECCKLWVPEHVFSMDICKCGGDPYIVEAGCFNSTGFYMTDLDVLVRNIGDYVERIYALPACR